MTAVALTVVLAVEIHKLVRRPAELSPPFHRRFMPDAVPSHDQ
jgi:hypothetical protein